MSEARWLPLIVCGLTAAGGQGQAQERAGEVITLRGAVTDSAFRPVPGVLVYLSVAGIFTVTGEAGEFALDDVQPGRDTLQLRGMGYAPRAFRLTVPDSASGSINVGAIPLGRGPPPTLMLTTTSHDTTQNVPVVGAQVMVNDSIVGVTDAAGTFEAREIPVVWGINVVLVRRVGYAPLFRTFWVGDLHTQRSFAGVMRPQAVDLPAIVVEGDRVIFEWGRMRDFWRRRERGLGRFFTRDDIERRDPFNVSDMLRMVPGFSVVHMGATTRIRSTRAGRRCAPSIWVDGVRLLDSDLDAFVHPQDVEAIEAYRGVGETPPEFGGFNSCGAIVVWTR